MARTSARSGWDDAGTRLLACAALGLFFGCGESNAGGDDTAGAGGGSGTSGGSAGAAGTGLGSGRGGGAGAAGASAGMAGASAGTPPIGFGPAELFLPALTRPVRVGSKDGYVYFTEMGLDDGSSSRLARADASGNVETLYAGITVTSLHLDDDELFFVERGTHSVFRMKYATLQPELFTTTTLDVADVDRLGETMWLTEFEVDTPTTAIETKSRAGGALAQVLAPTSANFIFTYLAVGGGQIYLSMQNIGGAAQTGLYKIAGDQGTLSVPDVLSYHLATDENAVYFGSSNDGRVLRQAHTATMQPEVVATGQARPFAVAVDADGIYWTNQGDCEGGTMPGSVMVRALGGGTPVPVSTPEPCAEALAVDDQYVYWARNSFVETVGQDAILRARKLR